MRLGIFALLVFTVCGGEVMAMEEKRVVLVTGASRGIGLATAELLAGERVLRLWDGEG